MSGVISLQTDASFSTTNAAKPTGADIAKGLIDSLDTNEDGEVSADELNAAFKAAGVQTASDTTTSDAVKKLDTDGNGSLSATELGSAIDTQLKAHHGHHGHHHGGGEGGGGGPPPSAGDTASTLLSALDTDQSSGLSLSEILKGLGKTEATDSEKSAFASMDANGDGSLDASELTSAITASIQKDMQAYAQTAYSQSASIAA